MKTWTLRFKAVDVENFNQIKSGEKSIETRAATVKYQPVKTGDELLFTCGEEKLTKKVKAKYHFSDIDEMVKKIPFAKIMPSAKSIEEVKKIYSSYTGYDEKIKQFGIFAFKLD